MSLINQMLRDLEKRRGETAAPAGLSEHIHITAAPRSSKLPVLSWALLAILTASVGYWSYRQFVANNALAPSTLNAKVITPSVSNDKAVSQTPLISAETNGNPIALGSKSLAPAEPVPTITSIATTPAIPAALPVVTEHIDAGNPAKDSTAVPPKTSAPTGSPLVSTRSIRPKPGKISNTGPQQQAELLYRQALRDNDRFLMVPALERVLVLYPQHLNARLLLAKTLHDLGQINKTAEFLDQSLALFPNNLQFVNTRAQIFLQQKNPRAALGTLQRVAANSHADETSLSLLAATYQQLNAYNNAGDIYQRLVKINPNKAEYWLGLALAAEKTLDNELAGQAYQQALSKNTLKPSIVSYIKQRLNEIR